jgi:hypothetical protein
LVAVLLGGRPWLVPREADLEAVQIRSSVARGGGRFSVDGRLYSPTNEQRISRVDLETGRPVAGASGHAGEILVLADGPQWGRLYSVDVRGVLKAWPRDLGAARTELETEGTFGIIPTDIEPLRDAHVAMSNNIGQVRVVELKSRDTEVVHTAHREYASALSIDESRGLARWGTTGYCDGGDIRRGGRRGSCEFRSIRRPRWKLTCVRGCGV